MGASSSPFNGLLWDDVKDRPLWTTSLQWDSSNKALWPIFDYKPGLHECNPEKWPGKVILVDTWVKLVDNTMSQIRRLTRAGSRDVEEWRKTYSILSGLLVEKWPLNFGPDAKSFSKQPKKPVDPKRPTSSILSLPETPQIITAPNSFQDLTDNDPHQYHLGALNCSTAIGNTTEDSVATISMRSADQAHNKNQQSTVTKQASTRHRNPVQLLVRLKLPTKLRSTLLSDSPPQPSAAGRRKQSATTTKKGVGSTLKPGEPGAIKATATQNSTDQSLHIPPQDSPRLNGGLLDSYVAFETSVDKALQGRQKCNKKSERELSECHKRINGLQAELEETRRQVTQEHDRVLKLEKEKELLRVDQNKHLEREKKLQKECEEKDARLAQMAERLREAERKLKENEKESKEVMERMKQAARRWEDGAESLSRKRQRT